MDSAANKNNAEGVIIISDSISPEHIIKRILDVEVLPASVSCSDTIKGYSWKFETKYYSAEVNLYAVIDKTPFKKDFANSIKASVIYFDSSKNSSFEDILKWIMIYDNIQPEVRIMVCNNFSEEFPALLRKNIVYWCAQNQFELVELNPLEEENDEDDLIPECKGYARIVQSLQAHTWENLIMKSRASIRKEKTSFDNSEEQKNAENATSGRTSISSNKTKSKEKENTENAHTGIDSKEDSNGAAVACGKNLSTEENLKKVKVGNEELSLEEKWINNIVSGDDPDGESFEALFSKFASMKERAEGLTGEARRKYAEEVAIAFWKAVGGDEDEIEGLDD